MSDSVRLPQIQFGFVHQHFYLFCWIATTAASSNTFTASETEVEVEGENEGEAEGEAEAGGETQGELEGEVGPKGKVESVTTISEAKRSPAVTNEHFGASQKGADK